MINPELIIERRHIYQTRLAILEVTDPPPQWAQHLAFEEAEKHIAELMNAEQLRKKKLFAQLRKAI